jgi:hypothetical protein
VKGLARNVVVSKPYRFVGVSLLERGELVRGLGMSLVMMVPFQKRLGGLVQRSVEAFQFCIPWELPARRRCTDGAVSGLCLLPSRLHVLIREVTVSGPTRVNHVCPAA